MKISHMIYDIQFIINQEYANSEESLDIEQIINFCSIYKSQQEKHNKKKSIYQYNISIESSPSSTIGLELNDCKNNLSKFNTPEFRKKYILFIRILHACLQMEVELFTVNKNIYT